MAQCVVCAQLCTIWCAHDKAFLCTQCDSTIHTANVISRNHKRVPVCELCKRAPATVYCHEDAAALCSGCEVEVHSANPLPHTVVPVEQAMASGAVKSPGLPFAVASPAAAAAPAPMAVRQQPHAPAEDEVSACGGGAVAPDATAQLCGSEGNTSLAVVPDILAPQASTQAAGQLSASAAALAGKDTKAMWGGDFDALDFEAAWLTGLDGGLDFTDILGNDAGALDVPGTVPTAPVVPEPVQPAVPVVPVAAAFAAEEDLLAPVGDDDFVVPSFLPELEEDLAEAVQPATTQLMRMGGKRPLELADITAPAPKAMAMELPLPPSPLATPVPQQQPAQQQYYHLAAPAPPPPVVKPAPQQVATRTGPVLDGANLTREQRVARYREKRKNRTFQKTIRYASRKAYAEVRPRIKGRFATKEEVEAWKAAQAAGTVGPNEPFRLLI